MSEQRFTPGDRVVVRERVPSHAGLHGTVQTFDSYWHIVEVVFDGGPEMPTWKKFSAFASEELEHEQAASTPGC